MKVSELIELLEDQDPNAEVYMMSQANYPLEYSLTGIAVREDFNDEDLGVDGEPEYQNGTAPDDVFIVEGQQLRYGSRAAWRVAMR